MKTCILSLAVIIFSSCGEIKMDQSIINKNQKVSDFLNEQTSKSNIPGIQYIVTDKDKFLFEHAGGFADIKNKLPMTVNTTMMVFSMTKTITAVAVLQLVENGQINLDDSISKYIDNNTYSQDITIRHLLSHTSGIPSPIPLKWVHLAENHDGYDEDATLAKVVNENSKLKFKPGEKYKYSNISYWLLGKIIEKVSGQSYSDYIYKNITTQLQVTQNEMSYTIPDHANHAKGYLAKISFFNLIKGILLDKDLIGGYEGNWLHINNLYLNGPAFGGLIGSSCSFGKFLQDQLKERSVLYNNETRNLFISQQKNNAGELIDMTLGWHIGELEGEKYFFKEGGGAGYHSEMRIYPVKGIASVIIVNKTSFSSSEYLNTLDKEFLNY